MVLKLLHLGLQYVLQVVLFSNKALATTCVTGPPNNGNAYVPQTMNAGCVAIGDDATAISNLTMIDIVTNITNQLTSTIFYVSSAVFVYGAFLYVLSAFKEENKASGQQYMIGAIVGYIIVVTSKVLLNLVLYFIYN